MKRLFAMIACWLLTGCAQSAIVMQLYDDGAADKAMLIEEIESFASENAVEVQRPDVTPAASYAEVTVVHGSDWETASLAWASGRPPEQSWRCRRSSSLPGYKTMS